MITKQQRHKKRMTHRVASAVILAIVVSSCSSTDSQSQSNCADGVKIAFVGSLTGIDGGFGNNVKRGLDLSVAEHNDANKDQPILVEAFDTQGEIEKADDLADRVIADLCVIGVVGPLSSAEAAVMTPKFDAANLTMISPSATDAALVTNGWDVFHRVPAGNDQLGVAAARRIIGDGRTKVGVVDDGSVYGKYQADIVRSTLGERVVELNTLSPEDSNYTKTVSDARNAGIDAIFFGGSFNAAGKLMRQLTDAEVMATFYAGDTAKDVGFLNTAGPSAEGAVFACSCAPPAINPDFLAAFQSRFDGETPSTFAAEAYDAASVFIAGIKSDVVTRIDMLAFINSYDAAGVTNQLRWTEKGEVANPVAYFYEVINGAIESVGSSR